MSQPSVCSEAFGETSTSSGVRRTESRRVGVNVLGPTDCARRLIARYSVLAGAQGPHSGWP